MLFSHQVSRKYQIIELKMKEKLFTENIKQKKSFPLSFSLRPKVEILERHMSSPLT